MSRAGLSCTETYSCFYILQVKIIFRLKFFNLGWFSSPNYSENQPTLYVEKLSRQRRNVLFKKCLSQNVSTIDFDDTWIVNITWIFTAAFTFRTLSNKTCISKTNHLKKITKTTYMNISALCNPFRQLFSRESHSTKKTRKCNMQHDPCISLKIMFVQ